MIQLIGLYPDQSHCMKIKSGPVPTGPITDPTHVYNADVLTTCAHGLYRPSLPVRLADILRVRRTRKSR